MELIELLPALKPGSSSRAYDIHRQLTRLCNNPKLSENSVYEGLYSTGRYGDEDREKVDKMVITIFDKFNKLVDKLEKIEAKAQGKSAPKGPKIVYVKSTHNGRPTIYAATMEKMCHGIFGYTLECGNSWNNKIPREPKTVNQLVKALNDSARECNRYRDYYDVSSKEEFDAAPNSNKSDYSVDEAI